MRTLTEIEGELTGPGGPFEIIEEPVLGEVMPVFKERVRSLRQLVVDSAARGDADYIVCDDRRIGFAEHAAARVTDTDRRRGIPDRRRLHRPRR